MAGYTNPSDTELQNVLIDLVDPETMEGKIDALEEAKRLCANDEIAMEAIGILTLQCVLYG